MFDRDLFELSIVRTNLVDRGCIGFVHREAVVGGARDLTLVGFHRHELDGVVTVTFRCIPVQLVEVFLRDGVTGLQQGRLFANLLVQCVFDFSIATTLDMHELDGFGGVLPRSAAKERLAQLDVSLVVLSLGNLGVVGVHAYLGSRGLRCRGFRYGHGLFHRAVDFLHVAAQGLELEGTAIVLAGIPVQLIHLFMRQYQPSPLSDALQGEVTVTGGIPGSEEEPAFAADDFARRFYVRDPHVHGFLGRIGTTEDAGTKLSRAIMRFDVERRCLGCVGWTLGLFVNRNGLGCCTRDVLAVRCDRFECHTIITASVIVVGIPLGLFEICLLKDVTCFERISVRSARA